MDADRQILEQLEPALREAGDRDAYAMLALVGFEPVSVAEDELRAALRRAILVLAAGGDPQRELETDGPAVAGLAAELDSPGRRSELHSALEALKERSSGLPRAEFLLEALLADPDLAWRSLAIALLADELSG